MRNLKKSLSLILALALLVSSVFVGGITASAETDLYYTVNTYDDEGAEFVYAGTDIYNAGGCTYLSVNGQPQTESGSAGYRFLSIWNANVQDTAEAGLPDSGKALRFRKASSFTASWLARAAIYSYDSDTLKRFYATKDKTYQIKLKYYVAQTPTQPVALSIRNGGQYQAVYGNYVWSDTGANGDVWCDAVFVADAATDGWVEATAYFTAKNSAHAHMVLSGVRGGSGASNVEVWIDDVEISECLPLTAYNFDGENDKTVYASERTTIAELEMPTRDGYILTGVYADAELQNKLSASENAINYIDTGVYYGWTKLNPGEYYVGFEGYKLAINGNSYDSATTSIVSGNTYAGGYNIKVNAPANSLNSFELRDKTALDTKAGTKYTISFQYRASADAKLYVGTALASDVAGTAQAIKGANLPAIEGWTGASIEVTLNKGQKEGYVPAFMVQATEAATVEFDHIYLTFPVEETQNIENKFETSADWYPVLRNPDEILSEEEAESKDSPVWNSNKTRTPAEDADGDGVYEIDSAEKLAYVVFGGGEGKSYVLTKNIYLNDVTKINWEDGTVAEGYTVRSWYTGASSGYTTFSGTIDGNGFSVYGLYYYQNKGSYSQYGKDYGVGLIPKTATGANTEVKNLFVDYVFVEYEAASSALIGVAKSHQTSDQTVTVKNCVVGENVKVIGASAAAFVGNVGSLFKDDAKLTVNIENCASWGVMAPAYASQQGLATGHYQLCGTTLNVSNSYNAAGPICGYVRSGKSKAYASNCYQTAASSSVITKGVTTVSENIMKGTDAISNWDKMAALNTYGNYWVATKNYPMPYVFFDVDLIELDIWDGTTSAPVDSNEDGIIEINNGEELAYVIVNGGGAENTYKLTANIFLNNLDLINWQTGAVATGYTVNSWYANKPVQGTFIGDGYTVYGLYYNDGTATESMSGAAAGVGLFPQVSDSTTLDVSKLGVDYCYINYKSSASPFVGSAAHNNSTRAYTYFDQCYSGKNVYVTAGLAAAFVGRVTAVSVRITNSYTNAQIMSQTNNFDPERGRFVGNAWSITHLGYKNCYNSVGNITDRKYADRDESYNWCNYAYGYYLNGESKTSYHATRRTDISLMKGLDVLTNASKMPNLNLDFDTKAATTMYTATEGFPILTAFAGKLYVKPVVELPEEEEVEEEILGTGIADSYTYWDGTSVAPTVGSGTEEDPFHITNGSELYYVIKNKGTMTVKELQTTTQTKQATDEEGNLLYEEDGVTPIYVTEDVQVEVDVTKTECYFVLDNDIYLNDLSKINWFTGSIANGYNVRKWTWGESATFNGHIDGNGFGVFGLYFHDGKTGYSSTPVYNAGLIGRTVAGGNVTVKNLTVDYFFSRYDSITGPIIGCVHSADATISNCVVGQNVYADSSYVGNLVGYAYGSDITLTIENCYSWSKGYANTGHIAFIGYIHWTYIPTINIINCYNAYGKMITENRKPFTATNCYEGVDGGLNTGVTTLTADQMKGEVALENGMAGIKRFFKSLKASFEVVNANNFVYLPAGTTFDEDFAPLFFDNRMAPLATEDVMFTNRMVRGAYVKFRKEVDVTKINVPVSTAHRVAFGTAQELLAAGYYDLETQVISDNLADQPDTAVNYLFITDPHFDTQGDVGPLSPKHSARQFALAIKMANEMDEIDFVALGGDLTNGGYGTHEAWATALEGYLAEINNCTKPVFVLVGNHDDNAYGTVNDSMTLEQFNAKVTSNDRWQTAVMDKFVNRTLEDGTVIKVTQDNDPYMSEKVNSKYYYYDLEGKNTRVICLNASDYEYAYDENGEFTLISNGSTSKNVRSNTYNGYNFWGYSKYQMEWLAEDALGTLPEDYNVIVLSHMAITADADGQTYVNGTVLRDIMAAYQNKTAYAHDSFGISVDFTEDTGRIMAYQHGHEHSVYDKYNPDCDVWQFSTANPNPHGSLTTVMNENVAATDVMSVTEGYVYKQALGKGDTAMYINNFPVYEGDITLDTTVDIRDLVALRNNKEAELPSAVMPVADYAKMIGLILGK